MAKKRKVSPWDADYDGPVDRETPGGCDLTPGGFFVCSMPSAVSVFKPGDLPPLADHAYTEWAKVQREAGFQQRRCRVCRQWRYPQEMSLLRCTNKLACQSGPPRNAGPTQKWARIVRCAAFAKERARSRRREAREMVHG